MTAKSELIIHALGGMTYIKQESKAGNVYQEINNSASTELTSITYSLTPCSTVLLEKLTGSAVSQEISRIFGTRKFITVLTSARHLSLS